MSKKSRLLICSLALVLCALVVFRKSAVFFAVQWFLNSSSHGKDFSYAQMQWEEDRLVLSQLAFFDSDFEIAVDKVSVDWNINWARLRLEPKISFVRPQVLLLGSKEPKTSSLPFLLIPHERFKVHLEVEQGILCVSDQALYFSLIPGQSWESIGTLTLSYHPELDCLPLLRTEVHRKQSSLEFSFYLHEEQISQIAPLWSLLPQTQQFPWHPVEGAIEITGSGAINSDLMLQNLSCHGSMRSVFLTHRVKDTALSVELLEGSFTYPTRQIPGPFWENAETELVLRQGNLQISSNCSLSIANASCHVQNDQNPKLSLEGSLTVGQEILPLTLAGQGSIHADGAFWIDLVAKSDREQMCLLDAHLSCCSPEQDQMIFQINCEHAELKSLLPFFSLDTAHFMSVEPRQLCNFREKAIELEGVVQGKLTLCMHKGVIADVQLDAFSAEGFSFQDLQHELYASARSIKGDFAVKKALESWDLLSCALNVQEGKLCSSSKDLEIETEMYAKNNCLMSSIFHAKWEALTATLEVHDPEEEKRIHFSLAGDLTPLSTFVDPEILSYCRSFLERTTEIQGTVQTDNRGLYCQGAFLGNERLTFGLHFFVPQTFSEWNLWKLENGWAQAEHLSERTYGAWMQALDPMAQLFGALELSLVFDEDLIDLKVQGKALSFSHPELKMQQLVLFPGNFGETPPLNGGSHLCYDRKTHQIRGQIPFSSALVSIQGLDLALENVNGLIQINGFQDNLSIKGVLAQFDLPLAPHLVCHGKEWHWLWEKDLLIVSGAKAELVLPKENVYTLELKSFQGNLAKGSFDLSLGHSQKEVARIQGELKDRQWQCSATFFECAIGDFFADPLPLVPSSDSFCEKANSLDPKESETNFWQSARVSGKLFCEIGRGSSFTSGVAFNLKTSEMNVKNTAIAPISLACRKLGSDWILDHFEMKDLLLKAAFSFSEQGISFSRLEGKWKSMTAKGSAEYRPDLNRLFYRMDAAQLELGNGQGLFHLAANTEWELPTSSHPLRIRGESTCALDLRAPMPLIAKSERPIRFVYSEKEGLNLGALSLQLYLPSTSQHIGSLKAETLCSQHETTHVQKCAFSLSPESIKKLIALGHLPSGFSLLQWESYLEGSGDFSFSSSGVNFQGELKKGRYGVQEQMFSLEEILLNISPTLCSCRFKTELGLQPVWGQIQVDLSGPAFGVVKLVDHPKSQGLTAVFKTHNDLISWQKIQGSLLGVTVNLMNHPSKKEDGTLLLTGKLAIDNAQFYTCLPEKIRQRCQAFALGAGYQFEGDLQISKDSKKSVELHGMLSGKDFELFGITFEKLSARLDATEEHLWISHLKIEDDAGVLFLKKLDFQKTPLQDTWEFQIPLVQVKEMRPSLFKKQGVLSNDPKPFVVKNLSLLNVKGNTSDPLSWEGRGDLNFINAFKKESSFFDLPLEIIKNFGIDPGLLTPVQGEVDFELHGDKFYLLNLKNAYSEGKRSQFFLALDREVSFIGLDGKVQIDLAMRQDVLLKLTEAFTLKIRGTLDKPRYGLQY
ncbi:MAG: hypothetical protein K2P51_02105 [Rhabdochlamydiaceae bacterium]|nr:hypothetical protein [Rhabdochlamydiaceae bacterium]